MIVASEDVPLDDLRRLAAVCGLSTQIGGTTRRTKVAMESEVIKTLASATAELVTTAKISQLKEFIDEHHLPVSEAIHHTHA